jgi:hypothetical protein
VSCSRTQRNRMRFEPGTSRSEVRHSTPLLTTHSFKVVGNNFKCCSAKHHDKNTNFSHKLFCHATLSKYSLQFRGNTSHIKLECPQIHWPNKLNNGGEVEVKTLPDKGYPPLAREGPTRKTRTLLEKRITTFYDIFNNILRYFIHYF